jgi:flagellar basal body rod protein FlgG
MIRGMYNAASALVAADANQELVAENLANTTTPGYRRQGLVFEVVPPDGPGSGPATTGTLQGTRAARSFTTFDPGPIQFTGNPLDLTLTSDIYFTLNGPNGPLYTRNGTFERNAQGQLQTRSGMTVRGTGGPITIPATATQISITSDGAVYADNVEFGRLQLARFADPTQLERAGGSLFEGPAAPQPEPGSYRVEQGYREGSNVQVVNEMVSMMTGMRYYEAAERALRSLGDAVSLNTRPQG